MSMRPNLSRLFLFCLPFSWLILSGCGSMSMTDNAMLFGGAATLYAARTPSNEIEQTYYLGIFDAQEQIPVAVYRIRVHGQASPISNVRFASGWVPAQVVDSLNNSLGYEFIKGAPQLKDWRNSRSDQDMFGTGRKLYVFGPEGFRKTPKDHRLVIVMGASPDEFFSAVNNALGVTSGTLSGQQDASLSNDLLQAIQALDAQERDIRESRDKATAIAAQQ